MRVSGRTIFDLDARLGRSTVSTCGIGGGRDPGEMKASVHIFTTVYHGSVHAQVIRYHNVGGGILCRDSTDIGTATRRRPTSEPPAPACLDFAMRGSIPE